MGKPGLRCVSAVAVLASALLVSGLWAHDYTALFLCMSGVVSTEAERAYPPASDQEMARLLKMIQDPKEGVRAVAAGALGQTRDPRCADALLKALGDKGQFVKTNAVLAFAHISDARAIGPLTRLMTPGPDSGFAMLVAPYALMAQGKAGMDAMVRSLAAGNSPLVEDGDASATIARTVELARGAATAEWAASVLKSGDAKLRPAAMEVCKTLLIWSESQARHGGLAGDSKAQLTRAFSDPPAARELLNIALGPKTKDVPTAVRILSVCGDKASLDALAAAVKDQSRPGRAKILSALRRYGGARGAQVLESIGPAGLVTPLDDETVAKLLALAKEARGTSYDVLHGSVPKEPHDAISTLADSADPKAISALLSLTGGEEAVAQAAMDALAWTDNTDALSAVVALAKDREKKNSTSAHRALISADRAVLLPYYVTLLQSTDAYTVGDGILALGCIGDHRATPYLLPLLSNTKHRASVLVALTWIKDPSAAPYVIPLLPTATPEGDTPREEVEGYLLACGPAVVDQLTAKLKDTDPAMRAAVARVLGKIKDARAVAPLTTALADSHPSVRAAAAVALITQQDATAIAATAVLLKDQDVGVRRAAALASASFTNGSAASILAECLKDDDPVVRSRASVALGLLGDKRGADEVIRVLRPDANTNLDKELIVPAVWAAGKLKDTRAVGPILDSIGQDFATAGSTLEPAEQPERRRGARVWALKAITGQDFGHAYYRWMAYWIAQGNSLEFTNQLESGEDGF